MLLHIYERQFTWDRGSVGVFAAGRGLALIFRVPVTVVLLGLMLQVQSELPVCGPAIVQVLLQRLATLRPGSEVR